MALIRMCVVSNCSQQLSRPVLWFVAVCATYWTHTTAVYVLMVALAPLRLPTHPLYPHPLHPLHSPPSSPPTPFTPPLPSHPHPLIRAICDITVAVKKVAQNPAVLAS